MTYAVVDAAAAARSMHGETSAISDLSGMRTDMSRLSHMSTKGGAGYITAGGRESVLEMEEETDIRHIGVGGKNAHLILDPEDSDKVNMEPVLQELKCASLLLIISLSISLFIL